jgi:hypothetical protein
MRQEGMSRGLDDSAVGPAEDRVGDPAPGGQTPDVPAGQPGAGLIGALIEVQQRGLWIVAWEQRLTPQGVPWATEDAVVACPPAAAVRTVTLAGS